MLLLLLDQEPLACAGAVAETRNRSYPSSVVAAAVAGMPAAVVAVAVEQREARAHEVAGLKCSYHLAVAAEKWLTAVVVRREVVGSVVA